MSVDKREPLGVVKAVSRQADYRNGLYKTIITLDKPASDLQSGNAMVAEILINKKNNVLSVPVEVVEEDSGKNFLWVVKDNKPFRIRVQTGVRNEREVEIIEGLSGGEQLIVKGLSQAIEYGQVQVVEDMQNSQIQNTEGSQEKCI
ncbi:MAG: hypothetical protein R2827_02290 [Bdellovibrionales bacterium]